MFGILTSFRVELKMPYLLIYAVNTYEENYSNQYIANKGELIVCERVDNILGGIIWGHFPLGTQNPISNHIDLTITDRG